MLRSLRRQILAEDPGLQRAYLAGRATLAVLLTLAVTIPLARAFGQPTTVAILALSVSMVSSVALRGPTAREQRTAAAQAWGVAAAALVLGVLVSPHQLLSYAAFVVAMAAGGWAGRRSPRGVGLGMVGFMTLFFATFTRGTVAQLPWLLGALTIGIGVAALLRVVILRDPPRPRLRNLLVALRVRAERLADAASAPRPAERRLARGAEEVDEAVLQLHDLLRDAPELVPDAEDFRRHLFAVVTLSHLLVLRAQDGHDASDAVLALPSGDPAGRMRAHLEAIEAVAAGRPAPPLPAARDSIEDDAELDAPLPAEAAPGAADPPPSAPLLTDPARAALQVAIAGIVSIAAGHLISPHRWYWAAMSAFFVFTNTSSRGATLRRAAERTLGTAAGVAAGLIAGYLLAGRGGVELVAIFPLLFLGYWLLQVSYAVMTAMMTVLFALMYDMMGMLTADVLMLRLAETGFGALAGAAAAYFIFPTRTREAVDDAFAPYFGAMDDLLAAIPAAAARRPGGDGAVLNAARELDRALGALRLAMRPVLTSPGRLPRALQQEVMLSLTARYWLHRLAARVLFHADAPDADALAPRVERVRARLRRLRAEAAADPVADTAVTTDPLARVESILAELARARAARP